MSIFCFRGSPPSACLYHLQEPRQSLRSGCQLSIFPQVQWFSKAKSANIGAFEGFDPLHHSGVGTLKEEAQFIAQHPSVFGTRNGCATHVWKKQLQVTGSRSYYGLVTCCTNVRATCLARSCQGNLYPERTRQYYRVTSLIRNSTPPKDHHRAAGLFLL